MKLTCGSCRRELRIDDSKAPAGPFQVKCPQCGQMVQGRPETSAAAEEINPSIARYVKRELELMKRELLQIVGAQPQQKESEPKEEALEMSKAALICESDPKFSEELARILKNMGYTVDRAVTKEESERKIEAGFYPLILLDSSYADDKEGGVRLMAMLNGLKSAHRRQTFVVLLSTTLKTTGAESAFLQGANIVVNKEDIKLLEPIVKDGQKTFHKLYSVFNSLIVEKNMRS